MSRKFPRLVLVASVAAGFSLAPMLAARAGVGIDVTQNQFGNGSITVDKGETVTWYIKDGTHTITHDQERGGQDWAGHPEDLDAGKDFSFTFDRGGRYYYFCDNHDGMKGWVQVNDPTATTSSTTSPTTAPPAPAPTPTTTRPTGTTPTTTPASSAGAHTPSTATPAPAVTTTKPKDNKDKKKDEKKDETTTTTAPPPPPPVDLPDSAIIPQLPGAGTTVQNGVEIPDGTPEGDAIALLKPKKSGGGKAMTLLIASGIGLGALGIGTAGYKYATRSSKYFPA